MTLLSLEKQYEYMRIIADCYQNNNFDDLYSILTDDVKYFSQRSYDSDTSWKDNVKKFYKKKKKDFKKVYCETQIVILKWNINENSNVIWHNNMWQGKAMLIYDDWKLCILMTKYKDWKQYNSIIVPDYEWKKISRIWICIPDLYNFQLYWPWNWEQVDWGKWIPKYKKEDTLRDEELCDFACNIVYNYFIKPEGYEVLFASNFLNSFPNFALKKDWKIILLVVRWCWAPKMPKIEKIEKEYFIQEAKKQWLEIYFAPVGFWAADPERFEKWLLLRWDWFYSNYKWIEPLK